MENKILYGMSELGLDQLEGADIFGSENDSQKRASAAVQEKAKEMTETDYLFEKTYVCPICNTTFKSLKVKASKPKLIGTDPDMRPRYQGIDVVKYDCVACEKCGYAALPKYFDEISEAQIRIIRKEISSKFKGLKPAGEKYTYDEAIIRYQLALANSVVKHGRLSERAYICLKIAWLYRGKRSELIAPEENRKRELYDSEMQYIKKAREGFVSARMKEMFPIAGMDEWTFDFLLAELSIECNELDDARRLISNIITSRNAPSRVKDKARELKDYINTLN
jgi:uncharacterized protein (DUF2225 family)